jgi:hypothetical protein
LCSENQEYNGVKEICEEPPAKCENGKVPRPEDDIGGGGNDCICPTTLPYIIDGVCSTCAEPKVRFESTNEPSDNEGECHCPLKQHWDGTNCIACPSGDNWIFNNNECERTCPNDLIWQKSEYGAESGTCVCPKEKPNLVDGVCRDCQQSGREYKDGICQCPVGTHYNTAQEKCITCTKEEPHYDEDMNICRKDCEATGRSWDAEIVNDNGGNGGCICETPLQWNEQKNKCVKGCPPERPVQDSFGCRRRRKSDCRNQDIDPETQKCVSKGAITVATWKARARHMCNQYLSGKITFKEGNIIAKDIYSMNNNQLPDNVGFVKAGSAKNSRGAYVFDKKQVLYPNVKGKGYSSILKNWRGPKGDGYGYNYDLPEQCPKCNSPTTCTSQERVVCPVYLLPYSTNPDYPAENSMFVTMITRENWISSCKKGYVPGSRVKNQPDDDWKCKLLKSKTNEDGSLIKAIPVPLPRWIVGEQDASNRPFWICPTDWDGVQIGRYNLGNQEGKHQFNLPGKKTPRFRGASGLSSSTSPKEIVEI